MLRIAFIYLFFFISNNVVAQKVSHYIINEEYFEFPGKWEAKGQLKNSGQYHFTRKKDNLSILISVNSPKRYEFYREGLSDEELLDEYYNWEVDYWKKGKLVTNISEFKRSSDKNYIIWKIDANKFTSYLLYAIRNGKLIGITLNDNNKMMKEEDKVNFLEESYLSIDKKRDEN